MDFSKEIAKWYAVNKRDLPWRRTKDPYRIWLSEVILQQTRVNQGLSYYRAFTSEYPTVADLANATENEVLKLWQGLGYYSRARNLHHSAKQIQQQNGGRFPATYEGIRSLKGVGDYTAAAISSICYNLPIAVVDGNVYRVLSRVFNVTTPIDSAAGKRKFAALAAKLINRQTPGEHNQAVMEFGAMICTPHDPGCEKCPINQICKAYALGTAGKLPVKSKKTTQRNRYFNYLVLTHRDSVYLQKRTGKDIWKNLYEFPLIETSSPIEKHGIVANKFLNEKLSSVGFVVRSIPPSTRHILTHQRIHAKFWELDLSSALESDEYILVKRKDIHNYAVPKLIENYLVNSKLLV